MARYRVNLSQNTHVSVNPAENGVVLTGPDYPRGLLILQEGKSHAEYEKEVTGLASEQIQKSRAAIDEFLANAEAQHTEQLDDFESELETLIKRQTDDSTE